MKKPFVIEYTRGALPESRHSVHALWVDDHGKVVEGWGDKDRLVCPRSSLKPLQALPLALSKGFEKSPDPMKALSIACASHWAEDMHVQFVRSWLPMLGRTEDDLVCGPQFPEDFEHARHVLETGIPVGRAFNNCSGKHTGMLAACLSLGIDTFNYHQWAHPLQRMIRTIATELSGADWEMADYGIDGCGLPTYHIPMHAFARSLSHFLRPEKSTYGEAMQWICKAWSAEPYMMAGHGALDSELAHLTNGRILAKIGAQGNFMAIDYANGRALTLKVDDGSTKVAEAALVSVLAHAGAITESEEKALRAFAPREIHNWAGESVGRVLTHF